MKTVEIEKKPYVVNDDEFNKWEIDKFCNVNVLLKLSLYERVISLMGDISKQLGINDCVIVNPTHGGFVPIACSPNFANVYTANVSPEHSANIAANIAKHGVTNPLLGKVEQNSLLDGFAFIEKSKDVNYQLLVKSKPPFLLTETNPTVAHMYHKAYKLTNTDLSLYVSKEKCADFQSKFSYCINNETGELSYDNLINLCIMVKNGGPQFEDMLTKNLPVIDEWTILDTGSTDDTLAIIDKVLVGKKRGNLYQEPFVNFRDSRNRLIELAGKRCKYILMLDDTYRMEGNLRDFLTDMRGDQMSDSLSLYIKSDDVEYSSNRIIITSRNLKYLYRIHEVIQEHNNMNVIIPNYEALITDGRFEYMEERTHNRKESDLKLLYEELEEDPDNPRTHYYLAQTYNLLGDNENCYKWYIKRMNHPNPGFIQEKVDAVFEAARQANFSLGRPWPECEELYLKAYELDKSRPDSLYFLGIHYYLEGSRQIAYNYFKKGFELGYPVHCQYGLKPTLSYHFLPKFLTELCYEFGNYELGEGCAKFFLEKNPSTADGYEVQLSWHNIFVNLNKMNTPAKFEVRSEKPLLCFVADGGFEPWTGADILTKGVGGSETYIIEMASYIQQHGHFKVIVFCNCGKQSVFEDVDYIPLNCFQPFAKQVKIDTCIISRFTEYVPVAIHGQVDNIYIVLHDLTPSGCVIPMNPKLKQIFCLSEWHVGYFLERFPMFKGITVPFYYGTGGRPARVGSDPSLRDPPSRRETPYVKDFSTTTGGRPPVSPPHGNTASSLRDPQSVKDFSEIPSGGGAHRAAEGPPVVFIYSSFPNRGLLQLLQMWPKIVGKYPNASLHIYADVDGKWVNSVEPHKMTQIRQLLSYYKDIKSINIVYHGWVSKSVLTAAWVGADYWLYPCTFMETFCLTALEAAISKTVCITNGLAALQNTVGDRGVCVEGDATTREWQDKALTALFSIMENKEAREKLIEKNYQWASNLTWKNQAYKLVNEYLITPLPSGPPIDEKKPVMLDSMSSLPSIGGGPPVGINSSQLPSVGGETTRGANGGGPPVDGGMLNWTHDLPAGQGARATFEKVLRFFVNNNKSANPKVLEVGTYAGTSLIEIIKQIPNSQGTAIDIWESYDEIDEAKLVNKDILNNYKIRTSLNVLKTIKENNIEELFYSNIKTVGLEDRITAIKGKSAEILMNMIQQNEMFDFIYVDGSHKCLDVAIDLCLGWQLLRNGGIMAIDDYLYSLETNWGTNVLDYPYHAVNHFLESHKNEFIVLEKGYRVFLLRHGGGPPPKLRFPTG
jgi:glycosyltransferase involved in cell wall biosynthesis/predicted O-methyltransferase YrrM/tetratricopeptide (TPR) repeat protein